jgi:hypothetical protein
MVPRPRGPRTPDTLQCHRDAETIRVSSRSIQAQGVEELTRGELEAGQNAVEVDTVVSAQDPRILATLNTTDRSVTGLNKQ